MKEAVHSSKAGSAAKSSKPTRESTASMRINAPAEQPMRSRRLCATKVDVTAAKLQWQNFRKVFQSAPIARIELIRNGVAAADFKRFVTGLGISQEQIYRMLDIASATVNRKASRNEALASGESAKIVGLAKLIGQVETMLAESGSPSALADFDASKWLVGWMLLPVPALGGRLPADYMDTIEGQEMIGRLLAKMQSGAYA